VSGSDKRTSLYLSGVDFGRKSFMAEAPERRGDRPMYRGAVR